MFCQLKGQIAFTGLPLLESALLKTERDALLPAAARWRRLTVPGSITKRLLSLWVSTASVPWAVTSARSNPDLSSRGSGSAESQAPCRCQLVPGAPCSPASLCFQLRAKRVLVSPPLVAYKLLRKFLGTPWGDYQWPCLFSLPPASTVGQTDASYTMFYKA